MSTKRKEKVPLSIHIGAQEGTIAEKVLLPGDPLRAKYIAETFFTDPVCCSTIRNMLGYTGLYRGERVSVQATGMGMPSASIYVHELIHGYGVSELIRVGTCGALRKNMQLRDLVIAISASTDSAANRIRFNGADYAAAADAELFTAAVTMARERGIRFHAGPVLTTDNFYSENRNSLYWAEWGHLASEMETNAVYTIAAGAGARALSIMTVSDSVVTHEITTARERERSFDAMAVFALDLLCAHGRA